MASSVNKIIIIGNVGKTPEVRTFSSGGKVCNFSVATSESWKDKQTGERKEKTEWFNVVIKNEHIISVCERYVSKGSKVYIEGKIETRKYEKDGVERYVTEVIVGPFKGELTLLDGKGDGGAAPEKPVYGDDQFKEQTGHNKAKADGYVKDPAMQGTLDSDIPFN